MLDQFLRVRLKKCGKLQRRSSPMLEQIASRGVESAAQISAQTKATLDRFHLEYFSILCDIQTYKNFNATIILRKGRACLIYNGILQTFTAERTKEFFQNSSQTCHCHASMVTLNYLYTLHYSLCKSIYLIFLKLILPKKLDLF